MTKKQRDRERSVFIAGIAIGFLTGTFPALAVLLVIVLLVTDNDNDNETKGK